MSLLVLVAAAALTLSTLTVATVALVQLVRVLTVRYSLLALTALAFYWFVESRRRRVARGFYSCTEVPSSVETIPASLFFARAPERRTAARNTAQAQMAAQEEEEKRGDERTRAATDNGSQNVDLSGTTRGSDVTQADATDQLSVSSRGSEVESSGEEVPVGAVSTPVGGPTPGRATSARLPDLRHRKWTHPSRSLPLGPKNASRSGRSSASNSPRQPELYDSPRSVAMEQKLMKSALETDGYWIGDYRVPPPAPPKRSQSVGSTSSTPSAAVASPHRRTGSRAV